MNPRHFAARSSALVAVLLSACATPSTADDALVFEDLGAYSRPATTKSPEAKQFFDSGLLWAYGFNHDEAVRCFRTAQRRDPSFAMAAWGEAWALGPNINLPMTDPAIGKQAFAASQKAVTLARNGGASPVERALIEALATRYVEDPASSAIDRASLDKAFAAAMRGVRERFPDDPDVGAIHADALLNTRPWDYWDAEGRPKEGIREALDVLRDVLTSHMDHPGAHHFHIHVTESSPHPEDGLVSAQVLADLVPGAGHLVHMPAHTLHRIGRYYEAEEHNRQAVAVDRAYFAKVGPQGIYEFYRAHNHHFLAWSAMYGGRLAAALEGARGLVEDLPPNSRTDLAAFTDGFFPAELEVLVRFGRWDELLAVPDFPEALPIARTIRHYARGVALAAKGDTEAARLEQQAFEATAKGVGEQSMIGINAALPVIDIARAMLEGEILYREGQFEAAFTSLRLGVAREDALRYDEPSPWMMPVRHALGALLLEQGRVAEAEPVYRADLARNPENGWSLHGLGECLTKLGRLEEAKSVDARFALAWAHADTSLEHGSCFCRTAQAGACCEAEAVATQSPHDD